MQAISPEIVENGTPTDSMPISETRFRELTERVSEVAADVARLQGATGKPNNETNPAFVPFVYIVGVAVCAFLAWMGVEVVHQGKQIEAILVQISPGKAIQDISELDETRFPAAPKFTENNCTTSADRSDSATRSAERGDKT